MTRGPAPGWRRLFRLPRGMGRTIERDVDDELAFHLEMRAEKLRRLGAAPEAARLAAARRFGDHARVRDECLAIDQQFAREVRIMDWLQSVSSDVRYALRTMRRAPMFTAVAIVTLALGIGATTAVFSLVDGVLLRPLPFPHPARLVQVTQSYPEKGLDDWALSQANFAEYARRQHVFSAFAAWSPTTMTLTGLDRPRQVQVMRVTGGFFDVLGVPPLVGRTFLADDDRPGQNHVAVLTRGFWERHFAADPGVVGRTIDLDGFPTRIVGIMPADYALQTPAQDLWVPLGLDPQQKWGWFLVGIGRLEAGVTPAAAQRELTDLLWAMGRQDPNLVSRNDPPPRGAGLKARVISERNAIVGSSERPLIVLQVAVLLILLIASANVTTLMLSRAAGRGREIALRVALGATGHRMARQMLTESVVLWSFGAVAGAMLAMIGVRALPLLPIASLPRTDEVSVNAGVLAFALAASVATALVFGLVPALQARRTNLSANLSDGGKGASSQTSRHVNGALVATQMALSIVLLIGAGLMLKSMHRLLTVDFGFRPQDVVNVSLPLPPQRYPSAQIEPFTRVLLDRIRAVSGVAAAAVTWGPPFWGSGQNGYRIEGHRSSAAAGDEPQTVTTAVSPGYFATLGIPVRIGRDFGSLDRDSSLAVAIVDETLAHRFWKSGDALGHRIQMAGDTTWRTIVGVVGAIRDNKPADAPMPHTYFPYSQMPGRFVNLDVRMAGDAHATVAGVRRAIAQLDPELPLDNVQPLTETISATVADRRLVEVLLGGFALLAVVLAAVGIYGVMSLFVSSRSREFGIRLAIGAEPANLLRLVLAQGALLAGGGAVGGIAGAFVATRWMRALLYDVSATDPAAFLALPLLLVGIALLACYAPSRRAARSDPLAALRAE